MSPPSDVTANVTEASAITPSLFDDVDATGIGHRTPRVSDTAPGIAGMRATLDREGAFGASPLRRLIIEAGKRKSTFGASDIDHDLVAPASPNALPAMFGHLAREGVIREVGVRRSTRPEARGRLERLWTLTGTTGATRPQ